MGCLYLLLIPAGINTRACVAGDNDEGPLLGGTVATPITDAVLESKSSPGVNCISSIRVAA